MPFLLSRGGNNVIAEVQRWQYFLLMQDIPQVGQIDGSFGMNTENATKIFQVTHALTPSGKLDTKTLDKVEKLGYKVLENNYYSERESLDWPDRPGNLRSPTNQWRNQRFSCFKFIQRPLAQRPDAEAIVIKGSCDGTTSDWETANIVNIHIPQLTHARGYKGRFICHKDAATLFEQLFKKWEEENLLHLIRSYEGCFVPRYKRDQAPPGAGGHSEKRSSDVTALSNHSFGSAFDINFTDNQFKAMPARCGSRGSVRELVAAANSLGIYWGGHFTTRDGMHFEVTQSGS